MKRGRDRQNEQGREHKRGEHGRFHVYKYILISLNVKAVPLA
jgi:hypothetical protein